MNIAVVGAGYVGLVSGMCFASLGNHVSILDTDEILIAKLRKQVFPIFEDRLDRIAAVNRSNDRVEFHHNCAEALRNAELVFLCVGTPTRDDNGEADLSALYGATTSLAPHLRDGMVLVLKSTVPVGTNRAITELVRELRPGIEVSVASNPEFLREGSAVNDFLNPDRVVLGVRDERSRTLLLELYRGMENRQTQLILTTPENAELGKYASNAFLAMKITFINEIANLCEAVEADVDDVARIIGMDRRIGPQFLNAGPGYGGSCFPKDTKALAASAKKAGAPLRLVETTIGVNDDRRRWIVERILSDLGGEAATKTIGVLGITFKANTDDVRDSPALAIVQALKAAGARIAIHDPVGREKGAKLMPDVRWCESALAVAQDADAVVLLTEWPEYRDLDLPAFAGAMRGRRLFDTRNMLDPEMVAAAGLAYRGIGRGVAHSKRPLEILSPELRALSQVL